MTVVSGDSKFGPSNWYLGTAISEGCTHTDLQACLNAASSGDTIYIKTGTYTFTSVTCNANLNIIGISNTDCQLIGKIITDGGQFVNISNVQLQTNGDYCIVAGAFDTFTLTNCQVIAQNNSAINLTNTSASVTMIDCQNDVSGNNPFFDMSAGTFTCYHSETTNSGQAATSGTISDGTLISHASIWKIPFSTSGNAKLLFYDSIIGDPLDPVAVYYTPIAVSGSQEDHFLGNCTVYAGANTAITIASGNTITASNLSIWCTATDSITGAGSFYFTPVNFIENPTPINVTFPISLPGGPVYEIQNNGAIRSENTSGGTYSLQAYNLSGTSTVNFITFTSNLTPTCDLSDAVTKDGNYIYRAGGTKVATTDGGTGVGTFTHYAPLLGNTTGNVLDMGNSPGVGYFPYSQGAGSPTVWGNLSGGYGISLLVGTSSTEINVYDDGFKIDNDTVLTPITLFEQEAHFPQNGASLTTYVLTNSFIGEAACVRVVGTGSGPWIITQPSGFTIHYNGTNTTTGVGGSLSSATNWDTVTLQATSNSATDWVAVSGSTNLVVV